MAQRDAVTNGPMEPPSLGVALKDVVASTKDLIGVEMNLAREEIKAFGDRLGKYSARMAIFGVVTLLGALPFLAFLVIGLGRLLEGN